MINAENDQKEWQFSKPIEIKESSKYLALILDEDVYAGAAENLDDLRIVNSKGQFVPFYIDSGYRESLEKNTVYSSTLVNLAKKDNSTLVDFQITPMKENTDILGNILSFDLPKEAFLKHVEVYGSYDGNQWELLKKDDLFRTDRLEKNTIELGAQHKFSYYRLNVLNNVENLIFSQLRLIHNIREINWNEFKKTGTPTYEIKQEDKQTSITIQNEHRLKIKNIMLDVTGNFTRSYSAYDLNGKEIQIDGKKELYRLDFKDVQIANTKISGLNPIAKPSFTIKINNQDNPSLNIKGLTTEYFVDKLVFEDQGTGPYQLLYGRNVNKPQYDIVNFKSHIQKENVGVGKLGAQVIASPGALVESPTPSWFQTKTWFNVVIIAVSLVLVLFIVTKMYRTKNE